LEPFKKVVICRFLNRYYIPQRRTILQIASLSLTSRKLVSSIPPVLQLPAAYAGLRAFRAPEATFYN
jgi:hypothetical protein